MSVILDALHKARHENEEASYSTSRAVDVARPSYSLVKDQRSLWRSLLLVLIGGSCVAVALLFVGLGWWWFSSGEPGAALMKRFSLGRFVRPIATAPTLASTPSSALVPVDLPPPVPLSSLPVQTALVANQASPPALQQTAATAGATLIAQNGSQPATTSGLVAEQPTPFPFRLGTILCDEMDCSASLNGRTVRAGDTVREHKVISVTATEVTLQRANEPVIVLSLLQ